MTVNFSDLFPLGYPLIQRTYFRTPGATGLIVAPPKTLFVRAAAAGAGGYKDDADGWGYGAAYAFRSEACAAGAQFTYQVGDSQFCRVAQNTVAGDTWIKRQDTSSLVYADRGKPTQAGLVGNSAGAVRRAGSAPTGTDGGASAGDDADPYPLGFGGRGASRTLAPWYGGGGGRQTYPIIGAWFHPPGDGMACIEFWALNPGYD